MKQKSNKNLNLSLKMAACSPVCPSVRRTMMCVLYLSGLCSCLHNYQLIDEPKTWTEALEYCRNKYTGLAAIHNMEDMKRLIAAAGSGYEGTVWIGHHDSGQWVWALSDGTLYKKGEWNFRKWNNGEPNDRRTYSQICVGVLRGVWYDLSCHGNYTFICYDRKIHDLPSFSSGRYFYINTKMTWYEAFAYCKQHHTDLASVRNDDENRVIQQKVPYNEIVLIGLHSRPWHWWSDHSTFRNWADGRPSNTRASCAASVINATHLGKWVDYDCSNKFSFMCHNNKKQVFKFKLKALKSTIDLNDPAVTEAILNLFRKKMEEKGITRDVRISWVKKPGKNIFHKEEKNPDTNETAHFGLDKCHGFD